MLWSNLPPRSCRVLVEQLLNPVMVLIKQRPDLLLLFRSQFEVFRKVSKFLVDRLRRVDVLKLLTRRGLLCPVVLSYGLSYGGTRGFQPDENPPPQRGKKRFS